MFKKLEEDKESKDSKESKEKVRDISNMLMLEVPEKELRTVAVFGDITEEMSKDVCSALWYLRYVCNLRYYAHDPRRSGS
mgnify:CR=1 FL=1